MFRFAKLSLAALIAGALVSGAQAMPLKQPEKPVYPHPQKPVNFNPDLKKAPPKFDPAPKKPPLIVTPNPKFYPKPYYPKYPVVMQTVVEPVYIATKSVRASAPKSGAACLSKETTAEGLVIFRDTCTDEVATTAIPGTPAAAAMEAQQAVITQAMAQTTGQAASGAEPKTEEKK